MNAGGTYWASTYHHFDNLHTTEQVNESFSDYPDGMESVMDFNFYTPTRGTWNAPYRDGTNWTDYLSVDLRSAMKSFLGLVNDWSTTQMYCNGQYYATSKDN